MKSVRTATCALAAVLLAVTNVSAEAVPDTKPVAPPHRHIVGYPLTNSIRRQNAHLPNSGKGAPTFPFGKDGTFTVLQMTDTHWRETTMRERERRFYAAVVKRYRPDLALLTGDIVHTRWKGPTGFDGAAKALLSLVTEHGIPFALTLGNHDAEHVGKDYYTAPEQWEVYRALGGRLFVDFNVSKLGGVGNGVIHLQEDGRTKFDLYILDSGDYSPYNEYNAWREYEGYDGVRREQIEWMREQLKGGVPALCFQHIPVCEVKDSFDGGRTRGRGLFVRAPAATSETPDTAPICGELYAANPERTKGFLRELPCPPGEKCRRDPRYLTADGLSIYEVWKASGCVKGAYFGHDHRNTYDGVTTDGVRLGASPASTTSATKDCDYGVRIFRIRTDGTYETQVVTEATVFDRRTFGEVFPMKPAPCETEYVTMSNACGTARVSLVGAHVVSYHPAGGDEVLFCPTSMPYASGMKLHGGIPICWPWFGNFGAPASQAHAFARYARFAVVSHEQAKDVSVLKLRLVSSDETRQWFPHDFRLTLVITLGPRLDLELITENTGKVSFEITEGFHTYLAVRDSAKTVVKGLRGSRFDLMDPARENPAFTGDEWRMSHFGSDVLIPSAREWLVHDADRIVGVAARGTKRLILYNPGPPPSWNPENLAPEDYKRFLCVEPVTIGRENAVRILPGRSHSIMMSLTSVRR